MFKLSNLEIINKHHIGEGQICSKFTRGFGEGAKAQSKVASQEGCE
jgi:hypothetical protein